MKLILPTTRLLEAADYRSFLSFLYEANKAQSSQFSYSYIAQRCQFSSKSFLKEVITGKKRLSLESAHKIASGLPLPGNWGKYFIALVNDDDKELQRLKKNLQKKDEVTLPRDDVFKSPKWPYVYAALGTAEKGATIDQIASRTRLGSSVVESALKDLQEKELVTKKGARYFANQDTAFFENLGNSHVFKNFYTQSVEQLFTVARKEFHSKETLFYSMALSVDPAKMPALRKDLAELLDKYTADVESAEGARIASLTCGFHLI